MAAITKLDQLFDLVKSKSKKRISVAFANDDHTIEAVFTAVEKGIEIAKEAIDFIVEKSDGSFRNLQRNFNELYLQLGKKLKTEDFRWNETSDKVPETFHIHRLRLYNK